MQSLAMYPRDLSKMTFGYQFPPPTENTILTEREKAELGDFFSDMPFDDQPQQASQRVDTGNRREDYYSLQSQVPPPNVHQVSCIPSYQLLDNGYLNDGQAGGPGIMASTELPNTQGLLPTTSILQNSPSGHETFFGGTATMAATSAPPVSTYNQDGLGGVSGDNGLPLVPTPAGMLNETYASVLRVHEGINPADATVAEVISRMPLSQARRGSRIKRTYSYGTDTAFNDSGYQAPIPNLQRNVEQRLDRDVITAFSPITGGFDFDSEVDPRAANRGTRSARSSAAPRDLGRLSTEECPTDFQTGDSLERNAGDEASARGTKRSRDEECNSSMEDLAPRRQKRRSVDAFKQQRENLTEDQKKTNHIKSEQKRRSTINHRMDLVLALVPDCKNSKSSKSVNLEHTAKFIQALVRDNETYRKILETPDG